jgi:hypothetical protein
MGADLVVVARRDDGRRLLLFVKACLKVLTEEAMRSLRLPYRQNRSSIPIVPERNVRAVQEFDDEIFHDDVRVAFLVFKFPADSARRHDRAREATYVQYVASSVGRSGHGPNPKTKTVLEMTVDASNAFGWVPDMKIGLNAMDSVKKLRPSLYCVKMHQKTP